MRSARERGVLVDPEMMPDFESVTSYPDECRERFMRLSQPGHQAPKWQIDQCLDDFNLWLSIYSSE